MYANLDHQLEVIERNSKIWRSFTYYDQALLQELSACLESCSEVTSDNLLLNIVIDRRPEAFNTFEHVAEYLFKQFYNEKYLLNSEQLEYLNLVGILNRRIALTLQNDRFDTNNKSENEHIKVNLTHQKRVKELLFDKNPSLFDIFIKLLPHINKYESNFIEMTIPWYESFVFFEQSCVDSTLHEKFVHFYHQTKQCLKSNDYEQCFNTIFSNQAIIATSYHRFYLGVCTMAVGVHVNCDENECSEAKNLFELYLSRYVIFINNYLNQDKYKKSLNNLACLTGIITFFVNYSLTMDNNNNRILIINLFSLILNETFYINIRRNWSTYETIIFDSIISYFINYCYDNRFLIEEFLRINENSIEKFQYLIKQALLYGNHRIVIMSQLFLLLLTSCMKIESLIDKLFIFSINCIQKTMNNVHVYHYNRIPITMFLKSLIHIVKYDYIQDRIARKYLNLFTDIIINYEENHLYSNAIYYEATIVTFHILWSLSFNENIRKILKQNEQKFFDITLKMNTNALINEISVKQATCGLLYNLEQLDLSRESMMQFPNFGKTIGISYDLSDLCTVEMIELELNKNGHRVWTGYDHMNENFIRTFISLMVGTEYLIICLSDAYKLNNRCRTEMLYAKACGCRVLSWHVHVTTNNPVEDEKLRCCAIETLLTQITSKDNETLAIADSSYVELELNDRLTLSNWNSDELRYRRRRRRRRHSDKDLSNLRNWTHTEVLSWCETRNLYGFSKLLVNFDGQSVIKLYEFCKQNSTDTLTLLNQDLYSVCAEHKSDPIQITLQEFIRFQVEVEKLLLTKSSIVLFSTPSLSSSKIDSFRRQPKIKTCSIV